MKKSPLAVLLVLWMLALVPNAFGQYVSDYSEARKARILDNLKFLYPQLQEVSVQINVLESSPIAGLDQGQLVVNNQQVQKFLVTTDDTRLYLLAADAVDVSKTMAELATAKEAREEAVIAEARQKQAALAELTAGYPVRGNPDASVLIVEFSDFQCPYCAQVFPTVEQVLAKHPNDVKFVYMHYPLPNHPWARPAAIASVCASQQDHEAFWQMHDSFFENQRKITTGNVLEQSKTFLSGTGIDMAVWSECAENPGSATYREAAASVEQSMKAAEQFGLTGTPAFFVNGQYFSGAKPVETFDEAIDKAKQ